MQNVNERLAAQNNGVSWRDCEARGLKHALAKYPLLETFHARYRRCTRCPVIIREVVPRQA